MYIFVLFDKYALPIISKKAVNIKYDGFIRVIQADINIPRGKSGGALLNRTGELIKSPLSESKITQVISIMVSLTLFLLLK